MRRSSSFVRAAGTARRRATVPVALLGGVAAAVLLVPASPASAGTSCPDADASPSAVGAARTTAAARCLVNYERGQVGLGALSAAPLPVTSAQAYAEDMVARGFFDHVSPEGKTPDDRLTAVGYQWSIVGENLARGQETPRQLVASWLASPPHCENLMSHEYTDTGFGVAVSPTEGPYWVEVFARPLKTPLPAGSDRSCPRTPAAVQPSGEPGAGTGSGIGAGTGTGTTPAAPTVTATRKGRRVTVRIRIPKGAAKGRVAVVLRVRQAGKTVRTLRLKKAAGRTHRVTVTVPRAIAGRVATKVGKAKTVTTRFR